MSFVALLSREGLLNLLWERTVSFQPPWRLVYSYRHYPIFMALISSKFQLHKTCIVFFRTCLNITAYISFNVKPSISASPALLGYRNVARQSPLLLSEGRARRKLSWEEGSVDFLYRRKLKVEFIPSVGILVENLMRYKLRVEELHELVCTNIWPFIFNKGKISYCGCTWLIPTPIYLSVHQQPFT